MSVLGIHRCRLLASLMIAGIMNGLPTWARSEESQWFRLNGLPQASVGLEVDGSKERNLIGGEGSVYDHMFITPLVGLRAQGSIFHPNLLSFDLDGELGWGSDRASTTSGGVTQTTAEGQTLNRYLAQVNLLETKPYNASFFAAHDHTYRNYGSFDTFTLDSTRRGGRINLDTDTLSLNTDFGYRDELNAGWTGTSEISEVYFTFVGINRRQSGQTVLTYRVNQYDNILNATNSYSSLNQSISFSDSETFGQRKQISATTGASYGQAEYSGQQLETIKANENITINHGPKLDSYFMANFTRSEQNPASAAIVQSSYALRHQLYDSLTSNPDVHGSYQENANATGSSTIGRYGLGLQENYTKRLDSWARLTAGAGIIGDHEDDHSTGGIATTIDEPHAVFLPTSPSYRPVYLNNPNVIDGTIQVTARGIVLAENVDYLIIPSGALTEIRLVVPPSTLVASLLGGNPDSGLSILATYQSDSLNNAAYEMLTASAQIRLDFFNQLGVYGRLNWMGNNAPSEVVVQSLTDVVGGADYYWKWFRTGAELEIYDSNFTQYKAGRAYQNFNFRLDEKSSLSFNLNETLYRYSDDTTQTQIMFLSRYSIQFMASLAWYIEGGASSLKALGTDQIQGAARTGLNWSRGKLSVRAGYEYNNQYTANGSWRQELVKNRLYLYLKRTF